MYFNTNKILIDNGFKPADNFVAMAKEAGQLALNGFFTNENEIVIWASSRALFTRPVPMTLTQSPSKIVSCEGEFATDQGTLDQWYSLMMAPWVYDGALMPDAHLGYNLMPIGSVIRSKTHVSVHGPGVDIGCGISALPFFAKPVSIPAIWEKLLEITRFGQDTIGESVAWHPLFRRFVSFRDYAAFGDKALGEQLRERAMLQFGSQGGGNHFANICFVEKAFGEYNLYVLLLHSGSRGFGAKVAKLYGEIQHNTTEFAVSDDLKALNIKSNEGQCYWNAMNLCADYAEANHEFIGFRFFSACESLTIPTTLMLKNKAFKNAPMKMVEGVYKGQKKQVAMSMTRTSHNIARYEYFDGERYIVHRKGASNVRKNELVIIPSSCFSPAALVVGKDNTKEYLDSTSHGTGRLKSRKASIVDGSATVASQAALYDVKFYEGIGADEKPTAYRPLGPVLKAQTHVRKVLTFKPVAVRMASDSPE